MMNTKETFLEQLVPGQAKAKQEGKCPFCQKLINPEVEFKCRKISGVSPDTPLELQYAGSPEDLLSLREFKITGLCQACQDMMFG